MHLIVFLMFVIAMPAFCQDGAMKVIDEVTVWVGLLILVVEYLIAKSKLKANSTIEFVLDALKKVFGKK